MLTEEVGIVMDEPIPFQRVGAQFKISGWIPESWLETSIGPIPTVYLDFIDIEGIAFKCTSVHVVSFEKCVIDGTKMIKFWDGAILDECNAHFVFKSRGRITLKLCGQKRDCQIYVPVIIKLPWLYSFPSLRKILRHRKIGSIIAKYESDLKEYNEALERLDERRKEKNCILKEDKYVPIQHMYARDVMEIAGGLLEILENNKNFNRDYPFRSEDREEKRLARKYRKAIAWRGPLLGGIFGRLNGFEFNLYSDDHGKHFHIIHRGRGINARFSFPDIRLINYKQAKSSISSKETKRIIEFLNRPEVYEKMTEEFSKRDGV